VLSDIRRGLRSLVANPSFVVLAVSCLSIGIGASAMTFTAVNHALLRPLGPVDPEGLVAVAEVHRTGPNQWWPVSAPNLQDWQAAVGERARLAPLRASSFVIGSTTADTRVEGAYATDDLFAVLGVSPVLGRGLQPQDELAGSGPVVVLSESYWRRQLNGDRTVIGNTLTLDGTPHTVVGVVPSLLAIGLPSEISAARMWVPLRTAAAAAARDDRSLFVVARLAADVGIESFTAQLEAVAGELAAVHPENGGWGVGVEALPFSAVGLTRPLLLFSLGAAALVLLIACANVANLTLANAGRRRHEFAVRAALGASSARLVAQLLSETLTVAALGAVAGLLLARFGLQFLVRLVETNTLAPAELPIDAVSFVYTLALTFATTALVGLLPALEVARHGARAQIAESGSGLTTAPGQSRLRSSLVVGQIAASLVLLIGAVLLSRSLVNLLALDGGVATQRVTSVRVEVLQQTAFPDDIERYVASVLDALSGIPGVESAAASANFLPLRGGGLRSSVSVPGGDGGAGPTSAYTGITPGFFDALGIPLLRGRTLGENEQRGRVAVVNQRLADLLWPNQDALGREFRLDADTQRGWITVVGVAGDVLTFDSSGPTPLPMAFLDARSFDRYPIFFFVRTADAAQMVGPTVINSAIESLEIPLRRVVVTAMSQVARDPFWRQQVLSTWFSAFGTAALALAAIGVYGVLAYLVGQRRREIGIRMAVGARQGQVLALVLRQGAILAAAGIALGLVAAFAVARALQSMLFGVDALEWPVFAAVAAVLAAIAIAASLAPALRASRVDPNMLFKS
jgi:putative ABC transport system permease protein